MYAKITTTITTMIDLDSLNDDEPTIDLNHSVDVTTNDPLPEAVVRAVVLGAAKGLVKKLDDGDE